VRSRDPVGSGAQTGFGRETLAASRLSRPAELAADPTGSHRSEAVISP